ncbi:mannose-1-phosphate guanylyltransferase/mannose-6-phosphate isomerase [Hydrogenimonas sp. SS33]|uniref:mannose-1-phosphate guanylyltransferase/mannose-6-phosphate isomerase n=1 Tax=Hydrogenimonas leucolamina TaxID=2954236 RepID=UPI00336BE102
MTNIILCGGSGTRLWPVSRTLMPKQFVKLFGGKSLFQLTVERNRPLCDAQFIVSNAEQYFLAVDQLEELDASHNRFLLEPVGRNTAPAIALACLNIDPDEIVLVTPSDHLVKKKAAYIHALEEARGLAEEGHLVTFGIEPDYPETGFGYIQADGNDVKSFREKPDLETARAYLEKNRESQNRERYLWNSGMFCFKAGRFLEELERHAPEIYQACKKAAANEQEIVEGQLRIRHEDMLAIPDESIDYAVMEKSDDVKVVPCDIGWSDLGSFDALYEELPKDDDGNTTNPRHIALDSKNNLVIGDDRVIATVDVEELMIVDTGDALLVSKKGSSQKVKKVVEKLKERGSELPNVHLTAHRPWGAYTVLEDTPGYKIKRIVVKPGKRLSLQKHFHRSEHWIVVSGTATVTVGDEKYLVRPNESTYIKMGEIHRLENEGKIPVVLIEAQVGEYTGEDDIVRLEDDFKRESP